MKFKDVSSVLLFVKAKFLFTQKKANAPNVIFPKITSVFLQNSVVTDCFKNTSSFSFCLFQFLSINTIII